MINPRAYANPISDVGLPRSEVTMCDLANFTGLELLQKLSGTRQLCDPLQWGETPCGGGGIIADRV